MLCRQSIAIAVFVLTAASLSSADKTEPKEEALPATEPKGVPLELKIINAALEPYDVDPRGEPMYKFQEKIRQAEQGGLLMHPTYVEMFLEITNTGSAALDIWVGGDLTALTLDLKGNGARSAARKPPVLNDFIAPKSIKIPAGKSHRIPLPALASGIRNEEKFSYVTEPGLYWLSATFRTGVSPAPKGTTKQLKNGFGEVLLKSAPLGFRAVRPS